MKMDRLYVDVNVIQTVPPSCMNRDDTGSPKTAVYGGVRRARVSSQSWKRAVRQDFKTRFDESELAVRTKKIIMMIVNRIMAIDPSISEDDAISKATDVMDKAGVKTKLDSKKKGEDKIPEAQALFFMSCKQADNLAKLAIDGDYDKKTVQEALNKGSGVEIALFGRMVADDPSLNCDASCQVAHSISTHRVDNEYDYYTAVDDRAPEDNAGAGMIGTVEYNSSTLYRYATIAVHDLAKELDDKDTTTKAIAEFVRSFILSMPTGKQNTFANRTVPDAVYVAIRRDQPVNLVGAFEKPVLPDRDGGGYSVGSIKKMVEYENKVETEFITEPEAAWHIGEGMDGLGQGSNLQELLDALSQYISERI